MGWARQGFKDAEVMCGRVGGWRMLSKSLWQMKMKVVDSTGRGGEDENEGVVAGEPARGMNGSMKERRGLGKQRPG